MSVSYEYYKIFYYVAKYRSFNKAAAVLSNSQPNISRSITNLEAELNCKLFNRSNRGVTLTDSGRELFAHVEAACKHFDMAEDIIRSTSELKSGILSIGFSIGLTPSIMRYMIFPAMSIFHKEYPEIRFKIVTESSPALIAGVSEGLVDIAFITTSSDKKREAGSLVKTVMHTYQDTFIAGMDYKELEGKKVSLKELMNYPLISLWHENETYSIYHEFFAKHGLVFNPAIQTTSTGQILGYTKGNLGIGWIHPKEAELAIDEKKVFRIDVIEKMPKRYIAVVQDKNMDKKAVSIFEEILVKYVKEQKDIAL